MTDLVTPGAGGAALPLPDLLGALLLFEVLEQVPEMVTTFGMASPIRANVVVLDGTHKTELFPDSLIFPKVLGSQLRAALGKRMAGRLGQGEAKRGQSPPWLLVPPTDADLATVAKYDSFVGAQAAAVEEPF